MQIFVFHLMPYRGIAPDFADTYGTAWVKLPNRLYDPEIGREVYEDALAELNWADALGYDGVCVNEHHQNAYGTMPSPNIMAATLTRTTKRAKIAILGNALPLRGNPLRIAEEVAMLDLLSNGRIISGFVRGIGAEYHTFGVNPAISHERFYEAHDLIIDAWTKPGPFRWDGRHYHYPYVNPWPTPIQKPHPPIWVPSQGSGETIVWSAERRYTYLQTFSPIDSVQRYMDQYREVAQNRFGYEPDPMQMGWAVPIYVGRTDEEAIEEARPHIEFFFNRLLRMPFEYYFPPGYLSLKSMMGVMQAKKGLTTGENRIEDLAKTGRLIVGSPKTVKDRLAEHAQAMGVGVVVGVFQFGTLPHQKAMENLERFANEVMPALKGVN